MSQISISMRKRSFLKRREEADEFYKSITPLSVNVDSATVHARALAGMLWSKQYYLFELDKWLLEHKAGPFEMNDHYSLEAKSGSI